LPLAAGQQPLDPLRPPPSGYAADPALEWVGCGAGTVPASSPFSLSDPWLVAVSYTCPGGTAVQGSGLTLTVSETGGSAGSASEPVVESRGDGADVTDGALGGTSLVPGTYRLSVATASACLWHLEVYRG
jgi:hypothetical protein